MLDRGEVYEEIAVLLEYFPSVTLEEKLVWQEKLTLTETIFIAMIGSTSAPPVHLKIG